MSIIPNKPSPNSSDNTALLAGMPTREVFVKDSSGSTLIGTGIVMLPDNTMLAPEGFGVQSGSINFGDLITLSESSGFLAIKNNLNNNSYRLIDHYVPRDAPSSNPGFIQMIEAENTLVTQPDFSSVVTTNPLVTTYTTTLTSRVNSLSFKANLPMTNFRFKITKTDVNVVEKYFPNKSSWFANTGVTLVAGDNTCDFSDSPLLFSPGQQLSFEYRADNMSLMGTSSGVPYSAATLQRGVFTYVALASDVTGTQIKSNLEALSSPNKLSKTAIQDGVTSVNSQFGDVVVSASSINAQPVNTNLTALGNLSPTAAKVVGTDDSGNYSLFTLSPLSKSVLASNSGTFIQSLLGVVSPVNADWNATSGLAQILNKPTIPTVNYPVTSVNTKTGAVVLSNTDVGAAATIHTHVISDVTGLQTALDNKITSGSSIPYSTLTGTPTIPAAQVNSNWSSVSGVSQILNKPTTISGYGITDGVTSVALSTALSNYVLTSTYTTGLSSKFNTPVGTTSQYVRGDGSLATTPIVPTLVSAFTNDSAYINQSGSRTAISLTTTGTSGVSTYNSSTGVLNVPSYTPPVPLQSLATRVLNTAFQVSTTRNALVNYSVQMTVTATVTSGQNGDVIFEIASDSGFTANVQTVSIAGLSQVYTLAVALQGVQGQTCVVSGMVPQGYYARIRTVSTTGTPTFTYRAGQEVLM